VRDNYIGLQPNQKSVRSSPTVPTSNLTLILYPTECSSVLIPTVTNIVNFSLSSGQFHPLLKQSSIYPLLKRPTLDKDQLFSYRPISNPSLISNIIELSPNPDSLITFLLTISLISLPTVNTIPLKLLSLTSTIILLSRLAHKIYPVSVFLTYPWPSTPSTMIFSSLVSHLGSGFMALS